MEDTAAPSYAGYDAMKVAATAADRPGPPRPPHFRNTYMSLSPPTALGPFLQQLGGNWSNRLSGTHPDIEILGVEHTIGDHLIIRVGKVVQKGEQRGLVIEVNPRASIWLLELTLYPAFVSCIQAELIPLPTSSAGTPHMLSELLTKITPVRWFSTHTHALTCRLIDSSPDWC